MSFFTSSRERNRWIRALLVCIVIYATLFLGEPLTRLLENQDLRAVLFLSGMLLSAGTVFFHALKKPLLNIELSLFFGMLAVYLMLFLRLGMAERTHLIEYSVLTIFILQAYVERSKLAKPRKYLMLYTFFTAFLIGFIDEWIQRILPNRVFDPEDILFNSMAIALTLVATGLLQWIRKKIATKK